MIKDKNVETEREMEQQMSVKPNFVFPLRGKFLKMLLQHSSSLVLLRSFTVDCLIESLGARAI